MPVRKKLVFASSIDQAERRKYQRNRKIDLKALEKDKASKLPSKKSIMI